MFLSPARPRLASCFVALAACTSGGKLAAPDASAPVGDGRVDGSANDAAAPLLDGSSRNPPDATSAADAAVAAGIPAAPSDAAPSPSSALTVYPRVGAVADDATVPAGPGLVLDGGTLVAAGITWARATLGADLSVRAFDAVIVSATAGDQSSFFYDAAPFGSAQTVVLAAGASDVDLARAAAIVARAEYVFFPGGEQSAYAVWNKTSLAQAVQGVHDRGGVVAGSSAGTLVLGAFVFDALAAGGISESVTPGVALADPFDPRISFTRHLFAFAPLADAITEVHFEQLDRMGRLAMFMARQHADHAVVRTPPAVLGIAVDEHAAIVIDAHGSGKLLRDQAGARAFLVKGGPPATCVAGERLAYPGLQVHRLDDPSQAFDFGKWCGTAPAYTLDVYADASAPFGDASPYDRDASPSSCP